MIRFVLMPFFLQFAIQFKNMKLILTIFGFRKLTMCPQKEEKEQLFCFYPKYIIFSLFFI